jgi:restriction endonuclease S subunit
VNNHAHVLKFDENITKRYVEIYLNSMDINCYITGAAQPKLNKKNLNLIQIFLPDIRKQRDIVEILSKLDTLYNDIELCISNEIEARQKQYEYYRDKLLSFK